MSKTLYATNENVKKNPALKCYCKCTEGKGKWYLRSANKLPKNVLFRTCLLFEKEPNYAQESKGIFTEKRYGPYILDYDAPKGTAFSIAQRDAQNAVLAFEKLGVPAEEISIFYSGSKGFHIVLHPLIYGATEGHTHLAKIQKFIDDELFPADKFPTLDRTIRNMGKGRMIRISNKKRSNGLHKIQISRDELFGLTHGELKKLAKEPRPLFSNVEPTANEALTAIYNDGIIYVERSNDRAINIVTPSNISFENMPPCLEKILAMEEKINDGVSFNEICFACIVPAFKLMKLDINQATMDDRLINFLNDFLDSTAYTSPLERENHLLSCWANDTQNPRAFSCGAMLKATGFDFQVCYDCPVYLENLMEGL